MMTEIEAKKRWCPFALRPLSSGGSGNRGNDSGGTQVTNVNCLASGCMAWRWDKGTQNLAVLMHEGYCGLAGRPTL
mgnify:CR=1 FL=1